MRETSLPKAKPSAETVAYDLDQVLGILRFIPEPSRTAITVAAFTGLRRGEIEGLLWENHDGNTLAVTRAMGGASRANRRRRNRRPAFR